MKRILISDGKNIKEALAKKELVTYDKVFVNTYDTSVSNTFLQLIDDIETEKTESPALSLAVAFGKSICEFGNEEEIKATVFFSEQQIAQIKDAVNKHILFVPPTVEILYFSKEEYVEQDEISSVDTVINDSTELPSEELPVKEKETDSKNIAVSESNDEKNTAIDNLPKQDEIEDPRIEAIRKIIGKVTFERDGLRFSKEQNVKLGRIFKDKRNFTYEEISSVTGLPINILKNKMYVIKRSLNKKENGKNLKTEVSDEKKQKKRVQRKTDATSVAKTARKNELMELASTFTPVFDESGKKLTKESALRLKGLFSDTNRNWKVSEICEATGLKKSVVTVAMMQDNNDTEDVANVRTTLIKEGVAYQKKVLYDLSSLNEDILLYANEANILPSGNIITDAKNAMNVSTLSEYDTAILLIAFGQLNEFDSDFMGCLIKNEFTYIDKALSLKPLCSMFKAIRMQRVA